MASILKRVLVGRPLASADEHHTLLPKIIALAVFASDAISSTAYATEEILHVLVPVAADEALEYLVPISLVVMVLLIVVVTSYRQTIYAYPTGGGSYVVSRENLGEKPALVAGVVAARRLRAHRGGVDLRRRRRHHLGVPRAARPAGACCASGSSPS